MQSCRSRLSVYVGILITNDGGWESHVRNAMILSINVRENISYHQQLLSQWCQSWITPGLLLVFSVRVFCLNLIIISFSCQPESVLSPTSSPNTESSDYVYAVVGFIGFILLVLILAVYVYTQHKNSDSCLGYAAWFNYQPYWIILSFSFCLVSLILLSSMLGSVCMDTWTLLWTFECFLLITTVFWRPAIICTNGEFSQLFVFSDSLLWSLWLSDEYEQQCVTGCRRDRKLYVTTHRASSHCPPSSVCFQHLQAVMTEDVFLLLPFVSPCRRLLGSEEKLQPIVQFTPQRTYNRSVIGLTRMFCSNCHYGSLS